MHITLNQPDYVRSFLQTFISAKFQIYIVGGVVRDLLMGLPPKDWDFATNATPEQIQLLFPDSFYDNKYGTVGIPVSGAKPMEITTFRSETTYSDSRRPDSVDWGTSIHSDLNRRDFTINAMALAPADLYQNSFTLIDPHEGQKDLHSRTLRAVGDPDLRFAEDALRLMRAIRIASQVGFLIEANTFQAIINNAPKISRIANERIRDELFKLLTADYVYDGLVLLKNSGLLQIILPEVFSCFDVQQASPGRHHIYDVGTHCFLAAKFCPSTDPIVKFATLLHDVGKPSTFNRTPSGTITFYNHELVSAQVAYQISKRFNLSKIQTKKLITLVRWHQFTVDERQTDSAIRRFMRKVGIENIQDMLDLRVGDRLGGGARETSWRLEKFKKRIEDLSTTPFTISDLAISGHDIMTHLNIPPGPTVGKIINTLFAQVLEDHTKNNRDYLLSQIEPIASSL